MRPAVFAVLATCVLALISRQASAAADAVGWANVAERALPAVVNITVQKIVRDNGHRGRRETFFGSGFVVDPGGMIVTNKHVIDGAIGITVTFADRSTAPAQLLAAAGLTDLAVLKADSGRPLPFLKFADSDKLRIGDPVLAIGNPLGLGMSVSAGIVSALNRDILDSPFDENIQTDASINHGNSGGPLLDHTGEVIGVNTALTVASATGGSIGIGYAIPSNETNLVVHWIIQSNPRPPGWIGVHLQDVTADIARVFGLSEPRGLIVTGFDDSSPAQSAGMRPGDILLRFGALKIADARALLRGVVMLPIDQPMPAVIWRNRKQVTLEVEVKPWPHLKVERGTILPGAAGVEQVGRIPLGVSIGPVTDDLRRRYALINEGTMVTAVDPQSEAHERGIAPGDVILRVDNDPVAEPGQALGIIDKARAQDQMVALLVEDPSGARWITLNFGGKHVPGEPPDVAAQGDRGRASRQQAGIGATNP